jgi:hypothetical protein
MQKLATQTLRDFKAKFKFENGKISLTPFTVKLGKINTDVSGSTSLPSSTINVTFTIKIFYLN